VCCVDRVRLRGDALRELDVLLRLGITVTEEPSFRDAEIVLDAIFGTGLNRAPSGRFAQWIEAVNNSGLRVYGVDVPSGLHSDSGVAYAPCVRADTTFSFTLPKTGLLLEDGPRVAGKVELIDIGIPDEALRLVLG